MSKQANRTLIGAFVLSAAVLIVAVVMILGSGKFFTEKGRYVLFFQGSVKGLNVGSPVMFRGVKVGAVSDILLRLNPGDLSVQIPVIIDIERDRIAGISGAPDPSRYVKLLIEKGLRAQLQLQSMVTGQLMVDFDVYPDEPARLLGVKSEYPEIPTIPSSLELLTKRFEDIPFDEILDNLRQAIDGVNKLVSSPGIQEGLSSLSETLLHARQLIQNLNVHVGPLAESIKETSDAAQNAFVRAEKTFSLEEGVSSDLALSLKETFASARGSLDKLNSTLTSVSSVAAEDSSVVYELNNTLREVSSAARSVRFLADYLEQHPEALLHGKKGSKGD